LERAVIGLGLCPFAARVYAGGRVRFRVSGATTPEALLDDLRDELLGLQATDPAVCETALLIHPLVLADFADYNEFLGAADATVAALGLEGELQLASFHPQYRFAGTDDSDSANNTNRSPHPMLHLLREASVEAAIADWGDTDRIYRRNVLALRALGHAGWRRLWLD
jgi:hypothetical protein